MPSGLLNRLIAEASGDIRAAQVSLFSLKTEVPQCPCESSFSWGALPVEERLYPVPRWGAYRASEPLCARRLMSRAWRMELGHTSSQFQLLASLGLGRGSGDSFLWGTRWGPVESSGEGRTWSAWGELGSSLCCPSCSPSPGHKKQQMPGLGCRRPHGVLLGRRDCLSASPEVIAGRFIPVRAPQPFSRRAFHLWCFFRV